METAYTGCWLPDSPGTMLIVDDDFFNRSILEEIFAPDYTIAQAEDGSQGLEIILAQPEQLCAVLLDVVMPRMNGLQVLEQLNQAGLSGGSTRWWSFSGPEGAWAARWSASSLSCCGRPSRLSSSTRG